MTGYQPVVIDLENPLGNYIGVYEAKALDPRVVDIRGGRRGAVTALLLYIIEKNIADTVIVAKREKGLRGKAVVAHTPEEVLEASGSKWSIVPYTLGLKEKLSSPDIRRAVFVGLPCQAQFLRQMKLFPLMESDFSRKIYLIISLFCMGTFAVESFLEYIYRSHKVKAEDIENIEIRGDRLVVRYSGGEVEVKIDEALHYLQHGCLTCPDYTGVFADISAGRSVNPEYTLIITRTKHADKLLQGAVEENYIYAREAGEEVLKAVEEKAREKIIRSYRYLSTVL